MHPATPCLSSPLATAFIQARRRDLIVFLAGALVVFLQDVRIAQAQVVDSFHPALNDRVFCSVVRGNGEILLGGEFTQVTGSSSRRLGLFDGEGVAVPGFDLEVSQGSNPGVVSIAIQRDGRIVIAGTFSRVAGRARTNIARLNADGTLDSDFNPGVNGFVNPLVVEADGSLLVGGSFTILGGQPRANLGRLLANGTVDAAFNPGADSTVRTLAVDSRGRILVGGDFERLGGSPRRFIGRLDTHGVLDVSFAPALDAPISALAVLPDDSILIGGSQLRRLNPDGSFDSRFYLPVQGPGGIMSIAVQANGQILLGGRFTRLGGYNRGSIGRLASDGTVDPLFNPVAKGEVLSLALQSDGGLLVGGDFQMLGSVPRRFVGRLSNSDAAVESFEVDGQTLRWLRSGSSPEVWRTSFEHSENGVDWRLLGAGVRVPGGWELAHVSIPESGTVRVRGQVAGGIFNGSSWFVESRRSAPWPVRLRVVRSEGQARLIWNGGTAPFQVQEATDLTDPVVWSDVGPPTDRRSVSLAMGSRTHFVRVVVR